jgi:hypothetical protein
MVMVLIQKKSFSGISSVDRNIGMVLCFSKNCWGQTTHEACNRENCEDIPSWKASSQCLQYHGLTQVWYVSVTELPSTTIECNVV